MAEEKKKWVALFGTGTMTVRFDYGFKTEEEVQQSLQEWATKMGYNKDNVILYAIGNEEEERDVHLYFCPRCGSYNEYGMEPVTRMMYRQNEGGRLQEAGYYTSNAIDCTNCDNNFEVLHEKYREEDEKLNKLFFGGKENEGITN